MNADTLTVGIIVNFIGATFSGANAELIGVESTLTIAVSSLGVVDRVDGTSHTISVADKIVGGAFLTNTTNKAISIQTSAGVSLGVESGVLTTDIDTFGSS